MQYSNLQEIIFIYCHSLSLLPTALSHGLKSRKTSFTENEVASRLRHPVVCWYHHILDKLEESRSFYSWFKMHPQLELQSWPEQKGNGVKQTKRCMFSKLFYKSKMFSALPFYTVVYCTRTTGKFGTGEQFLSVSLLIQYRGDVIVIEAVLLIHLLKIIHMERRLVFVLVTCLCSV